MSELPEGWISAPINELILLNPKNKCADELEVGFVPMSLLGKEFHSAVGFERKLWAEVKKGYTHFADGDVLLAKITPCFENGKAGLVANLPNGIGAGSTEYFVCRPIPEALLPKYLLAYLKTSEFMRTGELSMTGSVGQKRLPKEYLAQANIPLAPLAEQKRIADKLDALLARVDRCRARLDRVPLILKRFRQAVLAAATSGQLTEDWREEHKVLGRWEIVKLSDVATSRLGKMLDHAKNKGNLTPYLRNINVRWFDFDLTDIQSIRISEDEINAFSVHQGDVLVCEGGEPGRCAIWHGANDAYVFQKALHRVRVGTKLTPEWLCYSLKAAADSGHLEELFTGTTIKHLTGIAFSRFEFDLPSVSEQHEIVRRVEILFAYADRLAARYQAARAQVERLTPALLAKAFRGELVAQDPADEPAGVLLARLRGL